MMGFSDPSRIEVEWLLRDLSERGVVVALLPEGKVTIRGKFNDDDERNLRAMKPEIVRLLSNQLQSKDENWAPLRALGPRIGFPVTCDGKEVLLWGLSPHGAMIRTGGVIITVDPKSIK